MLLTITAGPGGEVVCTGEIDLTVKAQFAAACLAAAPPVVIDWRGVRFVDSAALEILVGAMKRGRAAELPCRVIVLPASQPERVLKLNRFDSIMRIESIMRIDSAEQAAPVVLP